MNYGRIRRGPMAADAFTQIKNTLFRDKRLSFRDKGIFGLISTHVDGFGVSAESIAACSPTDGVSAVKTSLRNLEQYGYLRRTRDRRPDGTLGGAVYFITDDPSMFIGPGEQMALEVPSSQPAVPQPPLAEPTLAEPAVAEPTVANHPHKKTNSKHTSPKNTLSPRVPQQADQTPPAATDERENSAEDQILSAYAARLGRPVDSDTKQEIRDQAAKLLADGFPAWWLIDRAKELADAGWADLAKHCKRSTVSTQTQRPDGLGAPCNAHDPHFRMIRDPGTGDLVECPDCHPAAVARKQREGAA